MLRNSLVLIALLGLFMVAGCVTKPIALVETVLTEPLHPDGPVSTLLVYGPNSDEFDRSYEHFYAHYRTYHNDLQSIVDDWDKYFLRYDRNDPFSE